MLFGTFIFTFLNVPSFCVNALGIMEGFLKFVPKAHGWNWSRSNGLPKSAAKSFKEVWFVAVVPGGFFKSFKRSTVFGALPCHFNLGLIWFNNVTDFYVYRICVEIFFCGLTQSLMGIQWNTPQQRSIFGACVLRSYFIRNRHDGVWRRVLVRSPNASSGMSFHNMSLLHLCHAMSCLFGGRSSLARGMDFIVRLTSHSVSACDFDLLNRFWICLI